MAHLTASQAVSTPERFAKLNRISFGLDRPTSTPGSESGSTYPLSSDKWIDLAYQKCRHRVPGKRMLKMKLIKRFTYKNELVTIQRDGFMQYYFEVAGLQRSHLKLTARGAERQALKVIDDMTSIFSSDVPQVDGK
jgi:hypothetical protein